MTAFTWAILAAIVWGFAPFIEKMGLVKADPVAGLLMRSVGVAVGGLLLLWDWPRLFAGVTAMGWQSATLLALGGFVASIVGQYAFYHAIKTGELSRVVPIGASYPLVAMLLGLIILREPLSLSRILGALLVVLGTILLR